MNKESYLGKTVAFSRFSLAIWKTESLLELGVVGINEKVERSYTDLIEKFKDVKGVPGPKPKSYKPSIQKEKSENGLIQISMDDRSASLIKKALESDKKRHDDLRFFLYSNIFVSVWAAFETYSQMLFEDLLLKMPEMLKSKESVTLNDIISNRGNIVTHLVERQIEAIGHFKIDDLLKYYKDKINFSASNAKIKNIKDYYFIRNIIAHKSGIIRGSQKSKLPSGIRVSEDEIQISSTFLQKAIKDISNFVTDIEKTVEEKFYKNPNKQE